MNKDKIIENTSRALLACIENVGEFLDSADTLIKQGHYREAFLLTMYAAEEIGKVVLIYNYPIYSESGVRLRKWKNRFLDHTEKFWFLRNIDEMERGYVPTDRKEEDGVLKNRRLEICYVDFRDDEFTFPKVVTENEVEEYFQQINEKYKNMKERHPSIEFVEKQLTDMMKLPRDPKKLKELVASKRFNKS